MEASKAEEIATSPDELQDLQDDQLIHHVPPVLPRLLQLCLQVVSFLLSNFLLYILPLLQIKFNRSVVLDEPGLPTIMRKWLRFWGNGLGIVLSHSSQLNLNLLILMLDSQADSRMRILFRRRLKSI